jgi:hypothetical protein
MEIGCPGCGRLYSVEEIQELVKKVRRSAKVRPPQCHPAK